MLSTMLMSTWVMLKVMMVVTAIGWVVPVLLYHMLNEVLVMAVLFGLLAELLVVVMGNLLMVMRRLVVVMGKFRSVRYLVSFSYPSG